MSEPYFPSRRLAYDADGTRLFYRQGTEYFEMGHDAILALNSDRVLSMVNAFQSGGSGGYDGPHISEVVILFPIPMTVTGMFFAFGVGSVFTVSTSKDTTSIMDGTWDYQGESVPGTQDSFYTYNGGVTRFPMEKFETVYPDTSNRTSKVTVPATYDNYQKVAWNGVRYSEVFPGLGSPGDGDMAETYGVVPQYGEAWQAIKAIKLSLTSDSYTLDEFPCLNLHMYGYESFPLLEGLSILRGDGLSLTPWDLNFGTILYADDGSSPEKVLGPFRVRNNSSAMVAIGVSLGLTHPEDWTFFSSGTEYSPVLGRMAIRRTATGPWVTASNLIDSGIPVGGPMDLYLGDLLPGTLSDEIYVRCTAKGDGPFSSGSHEVTKSKILLTPKLESWS